MIFEILNKRMENQRDFIRILIFVSPKIYRFDFHIFMKSFDN